VLRRADFRAAYELGMRRASRHFTAFGRRRGAAGGVRFGITVSRKLGPAVVRNRIRRRTRELLRRLPELTGDWDVVINPRPAVATAAVLPLGRELGELMQRLCEALPQAEPHAGKVPS
jgi:ribonuclease P protein component